ncbi:hypothetical protein Q1695_008040 [Nippostrongylus brasiliensis]|nr:hypothetical protein Q1695_008040 [Nippostrongylus brasiliensis]
MHGKDKKGNEEGLREDIRRLDRDIMETRNKLEAVKRVEEQLTVDLAQAAVGGGDARRGPHKPRSAAEMSGEARAPKVKAQAALGGGDVRRGPWA